MDIELLRIIVAFIAIVLIAMMWKNVADGNRGPLMPHRMKEYRELPGWLPGCALLVAIALAALVILLSE